MWYTTLSQWAKTIGVLIIVIVLGVYIIAVRQDKSIAFLASESRSLEGFDELAAAKTEEILRFADAAGVPVETVESSSQLAKIPPFDLLGIKTQGIDQFVNDKFGAHRATIRFSLVLDQEKHFEVLVRIPELPNPQASFTVLSASRKEAASKVAQEVAKRIYPLVFAYERFDQKDNLSARKFADVVLAGSSVGAQHQNAAGLICMITSQESRRSGPIHCDQASEFDRAYTLHKNRRQQEAIPLYRSYLRLHPNDVPTLVNLGNALRQTGKPEEAIPEFWKAFWRQPTSAPTVCFAALSLEESERIPDAINAYEQTLSLDPNIYTALVRLAKLYQEQRQPAKSAEYKKRADEWISPPRTCASGITLASGGKPRT